MMGVSKAEEAKVEAMLLKYDFEWRKEQNTPEQDMHEAYALAFLMDDEEKALYNKIREFKPKPNPHGKVVSTRFEPYHDVTVYEDGHEEWYYIGD